MTSPPKIDRLVRSSRKTIAIIIRPDGALEVRAPKRAAMAHIVSFVESKRDWIAKHQAEVKQRQPLAAARQFTEGEAVLLLGQTCRLRLEKERQIPHLDGELLRFPLLAPARSEAALIAWYQRMARQIITSRVAELAAQHRWKYAAIRINSAQTRWGSCSSRNGLNFTYRLVMAPPHIVDYVIIHELAHTAEHNHGPNFWKLVALAAPDYQRSIDWLSRNGRLLKVELAAEAGQLSPLEARPTQ
jgi:predicted metal-dependent hydrolase